VKQQTKVSLDQIEELFERALYNRVQAALFDVALGMSPSLEELNELKIAVSRMVEARQKRAVDDFGKPGDGGREPLRARKRQRGA
jgi:hypothetical protein